MKNTHKISFTFFKPKLKRGKNENEKHALEGVVCTGFETIDDDDDDDDDDAPPRRARLLRVVRLQASARGATTVFRRRWWTQ